MLRKLAVLSMIDAVQSWFVQIQRIFSHKITHMNPVDYCVIAVLVISIGFCLLRSQNT